MTTEEISWKSKEGLKIAAKTWEPSEKAKAIIAIVHGLGEHLGRYEHVAKYFVNKGYAVIAYDRSGHGKSEGKRGHNASFDNYFSEIDKLVRQAQMLGPEVPVFLYGHSMGAVLSLKYLMTQNKIVKAAIISGPPLKLAFEPPAFKVKASKFLRKIMPSMTVGNELDLNALSFNQKNIADYKKDPLVHSKISFETVTGLFETTDYVNANADKIKIPLLIMHGKQDGICNYEGSEIFADGLKLPVAVKIWDKMKHEIHNEDKFEDVLQTAVSWFNANL